MQPKSLQWLEGLRGTQVLRRSPRSDGRIGKKVSPVRSWRSACGLALLWAVAGGTAGAQTLTSIYSFDWNSGSHPSGPLAQGLDGKLYGTTTHGGAHRGGTAFNIDTTGNLTTLHFFGCTEGSLCGDGAFPQDGLTLGTDGNFYGTTPLGGANCGTTGCGMVFKINARGVRTILYNFCAQPNCSDGSSPNANLLLGTDGNFWGTTAQGGANLGGTVFKINPSGSLTTVFSFAANSVPNGGLVQGVDGSFYGTTGGSAGTAFRISPAGALTVLHSFGWASPQAGLVLAADGNFYGTTTFGGTDDRGTFFKITPGGSFSTVYSFNYHEGFPGQLTQASDGNFYGPSPAEATGYIFRLTPGGEWADAADFYCVDGAGPLGGVFQGTDGKLYGTTNFGGTSATGGDDCCEGSGDCTGFGTVFGFDVGLPPFVKTVPIYGIVGQGVKILGNHLTGATLVSFHGTATQFTVVSDTEIDATVPAGAITGTVHVTTPSATLASYPIFHVMPQLTSFTPSSGGVGTLVTISGRSLTPIKKVQFNGVQASFTVVNDTTVTATIPTGATTGPITVFSPGGAATSVTNFALTP